MLTDDGPPCFRRASFAFARHIIVQYVALGHDGRKVWLQ
jgi:hypothetical protein